VKGNLDSAYANFHTKVLNKDIRISWYLFKKDNVNTSFIF
jgi:hypothetical protein